jgi:hypothetical protein
MDSDEVAAVVAEVTALVNEHYVDPAAAVQITRALAASLAGGRYAADEQSLAAAVTADLQSVNGDKHLRLVYHAAPLPASEHAYDLQQLGRATIIGQRTKGGAHAREGFRVHPHLEATISVARAVSPVTGGNWEGSGVTPDIRTSPGDEKDRAYQLALDHVAAAPGATAAEAG